MLPHYWASLRSVDAAAAAGASGSAGFTTRSAGQCQEELTEERPTEIARHHRRR